MVGQVINLIFLLFNTIKQNNKTKNHHASTAPCIQWMCREEEGQPYPPASVHSPGYLGVGLCGESDSMYATFLWSVFMLPEQWFLREGRILTAPSSVEVGQCMQQDAGLDGLLGCPSRALPTFCFIFARCCYNEIEVAAVAFPSLFFPPHVLFPIIPCCLLWRRSKSCLF